jgi:hypothetical protein
MSCEKIPENSTAAERKEYARPLLKNYGSLADLTLGGLNIGSDAGICNSGAAVVNPDDNCS